MHTHSSEHTPRAVGSHLSCGARGAVGGSLPCSRAPRVWCWGWRERWTFPPPTYNPCQYRDSNPRALGYESDSLTIRPRLPQFCHDFTVFDASKLYLRRTHANCNAYFWLKENLPTFMYILLCCVFIFCTVYWADLTWFTFHYWLYSV